MLLKAVLTALRGGDARVERRHFLSVVCESRLLLILTYRAAMVALPGENAGLVLE